MRIRVRDHVNPLSRFFLQPPAPLQFAEIFARPEQPLHLDLGCALGGFVLQMAQINSTVNFLGLDIRELIIERARQIAEPQKLENLHYKFCNATFALDSLLKEMPAGVLRTVTIQFSDPHFKKKHAKRRMVQPPLVGDLARFCCEGAKVFVQTDIEDLAVDICEKFEQNENFRRVHAEKWFGENPFPVKTEREKVVEADGLPVFRAMFERAAGFEINSNGNE